jgi:hypothetical protein
MVVNGTKSNGESVTINLSRWQVFIGVILAFMLTINAGFSLVDNMWGEPKHYINNSELRAAMQSTIGPIEEYNNKEHQNIRFNHDRDISGLQMQINKTDKNYDKLDAKIDQVLKILAERANARNP